MIKIEWTDELSVGIEDIDKQHIILVRAINLLSLANERAVDKELMDAIFHTLADYTQTHFAYEEKMFDNAGFPADESEAHKKTHIAFLERVTALKAKFDEGDPETSKQVLAFLVDWLRSHIMKSDRDYMPYVIGQNEEMKKAG